MATSLNYIATTARENWSMKAAATATVKYFLVVSDKGNYQNVIFSEVTGGYG